MFALKTRQEELTRAQDLLEGYLDIDEVNSSEYPMASLDVPLVSSIAEDFLAANLTQKDFNFFLKKQLAVLFVSFVIAFFLSKSLIILISPIFFLISCINLKLKVKKRTGEFEKDYTALLLSLASSVKTGMDPLYALCESRKMFSKDSVIFEELKKLNDQVNAGFSEFEVIQSFASSIRHPDIQLFRTAFILARMEGSSLAECLQRLARVTRQRQSFRRKVKGAVAMQKLSAFGIAGCALAIGLIQFTTNPEAFTKALEHPIGSKLLYAGLALILAGIAWMMSMARARI